MPTRNYYKKLNSRKKYMKRVKRIRHTRKIKGGDYSDNNEKIKNQILSVIDNAGISISDEDKYKIKEYIGKNQDFNEGLNSLIENIKRSLNNPSQNKINETVLQILFQPDTSKLYSKQGSASSSNFETGDIFVRVRNKDANLIEHFNKKFRSVDSLLANILNKCNDVACLTSNNPPTIAKQEIKIKDKRNT